jgi:hypothetical protein
MGYTHYFKNNKEISTDAWNKITEDFKKILKVMPTNIELDGCYKGKEVFIDNEEICFNGIGDDSHETFYINKEIIDFEFCKTAYKPYDLPACCCLLIANYHSPSFTFSSDGDIDDWQDAINLVETTLNIKLDLSYFKEDEE